MTAAESEGTKRHTAMILAVVALIHLAIAYPALDPAPHNGGDNAGYLSLAHSLATGAGYVEAWDPALAPHTKYPPLYPALLAGAMGLGALGTERTIEPSHRGKRAAITSAGLVSMPRPWLT